MSKRSFAQITSGLWWVKVGSSSGSTNDAGIQFLDISYKILSKILWD